MNHIINAFKNLPRRGQHNFVKILCLALGLAISSVIIAEIYFEQTYDTYFPSWERTYIIRKTKCFRILERNAKISKTKRNFSRLYSTPQKFKKIDRLRRNEIHLKAVRMMF